jgi:hypothetical protein
MTVNAENMLLVATVFCKQSAFSVPLRTVTEFRYPASNFRWKDLWSTGWANNFGFQKVDAHMCNAEAF